MIQTSLQELPHGITLSCRTAGDKGRPVLMFLHGFPEAAFVWDVLLDHFAQSENGGYRCVAPNLRGFERSSAPADVAAYRAKFLVLLTKSDKLNKTDAAKALQIVKLQAGGGSVKLFSALKRQGVEEVAQQLWDWAHPVEKPGKRAKADVDVAGEARVTAEPVGKPK